MLGGWCRIHLCCRSTHRDLLRKAVKHGALSMVTDAATDAVRPFLKCHFYSHPIQWCFMVPITRTCVFPRQDTRVPQRHKATVFMGLLRLGKQQNGKDRSEPHSAVFPPPANGATAEVNIHPGWDQREPEHICCSFNVIINGRGG